MRCGFQPAISTPSSRILPPLGTSSPDNRLMTVDLPAPFGPISAWISPRPRLSDRSRTAASPPKLLPSPLTRKTGSGIGRDFLGWRHARLARPAQPGDPMRQQQYSGDHEQAHRQEPMGGPAGQQILGQYQ